MKIETGKIISKDLIEDYITMIPSFSSYIDKITFKKKKFKKKELVYDCYYHQIYIHKDKIVWYLKPYPFYNFFNINKIIYNGYESVTPLPEYVYYNRFLKVLLIYLRNLTESLFNYNDGNITNLSIVNYGKLRNILDVIRPNLEKMDDMLFYFNNYKKDNDDIYKHFSALLHWQEKDLISMKKQYKEYTYRKFSYYVARYNRCKYTGFKGTYTAHELYQGLMPIKKIMSFYSWKAMLDEILEPIKYKSKFSTKTFYFYTSEHLTIAKYLIQSETDKINQDYQKIVNDLGGTDDKIQTTFIPQRNNRSNSDKVSDDWLV